MTEKLRHVCKLHNVEFYDIIKNFEQIHEVPPVDWCLCKSYEILKRATMACKDGLFVWTCAFESVKKPSERMAFFYAFREVQGRKYLRINF